MILSILCFMESRETLFSINIFKKQLKICIFQNHLQPEEWSENKNYFILFLGDEWRLLPRILSSENNCTGTPLIAILSSGLTASLLAFICPLRLAVRLTCICPLLQNCLMASEAIYNQYRPPGDNITIRKFSKAYFVKHQ